MVILARWYTGRRRSRNAAPRVVINSIKNTPNFSIGTTGTKDSSTLIAKAVNSPSSTVANDVSQGCIIKAIYCIFDGCGLGGTGVLNNMDFYIIKNPGDNLSTPDPRSVGTSNEKKFVFRQWHFMIMRNQDGNTPFHWEGWIKIPRIYQRMGTDDTFRVAVQNTAALTGHFSSQFVYKWYR